MLIRLYNEVWKASPKNQDGRANTKQKVSCSLDALGWSLLLLQLLVQLTSALNEICPHECIPLAQCPALMILLNDPVTADIEHLRKLTCSVTPEPTVCCPGPRPSLLPTSCGQGPEVNRIHGGTEAPIDAHPWMAVLGYSEAGVKDLQFLCGGAVINERYVLTAAHCVLDTSLRGKKLEVIRLGEWDLSTKEDCERTNIGFQICAPPAQDFSYEKVIPHPKYNTRVQFSDDIALIRLSRPVDLSGRWVHPVCLPPQGLNVRTAAGDREPLVAGWGFTENGTTSERKLHVPVPFVGKQECNATYRGEMVPEQLCLGGRAGQDSCAGDSGGPLMVSGPKGPPFLLIGVVSYGPISCGQEGVPGVYTSVSQYRDWIEDNMSS